MHCGYKENISNLNIAKYFLDNYPDMVVSRDGSYTPITEEQFMIKGSNYCDGQVIGVAKWSNDNNYCAVLFYTQQSLNNINGFRVVVNYGNDPQGSTWEWFYD